MSENSDAVVVIVSEETGVISTAVEGKLVRNYNKDTLTRFLRAKLANENDEDKRRFRFLDKVKEMRERSKNK